MIFIDNISKIYNRSKPNEKIALEDISLKIEEKEFILLTGNSGSGKTTLLSLIAALIKPTKGQIIVNNKVISKFPDSFASTYRREKTGIIFQKFNLIESLSVIDNILIPQIPLKQKNTNYAYELLSHFQITDLKNKPVKFLSGGERQKVAIIRALINQPEIILADEPTANLDKKSVDNFLEIISEIHKNYSKTIIVATHDKRLENIKTNYRYICLKNGKIEKCS
jgi:putative ABC transport system ATP-binding protein